MIEGSQAGEGVVVAAAVGVVAFELRTVDGEGKNRSLVVGQYTLRWKTS